MVQLVIQWLESSQHSLAGLGWVGVLAFALIFAGAQMFLLPGSPLAMAAGILFGFVTGWLSITIGCLVGATVNFLISRHLARRYVERKLGTNPKFRMIDAAIGRGGWKIVALLRFVPIPFGVANYAYGLTPVRFAPYFGATLLATIPPNCFFVGMGTTLKDVTTAFSKDRQHSPLELIFPILGVIAAFIAFKYITRLARAAVESGEPATATAE